MVIDPFGKIILDLGTEEGVGFAEIDLEYLNKVRKEMPCFNHRREDVYRLVEVKEVVS